MIVCRIRNRKKPLQSEKNIYKPPSLSDKRRALSTFVTAFPFIKSSIVVFKYKGI
jgi:hypothetical protein